MFVETFQVNIIIVYLLNLKKHSKMTLMVESWKYKITIVLTNKTKQMCFYLTWYTRI